MTPELEQRLRRLEGLDKAATPAPWHAMPADRNRDVFRLFYAQRYIGSVGNSDETLPQREANAFVVVEARNALPCLIAALREAVKALEKLIEMNIQTAVDKYGDAEKAESWSCVITARESLSTIETLLKK